MQDLPSRTAWAVALRRAVHQLLDRPLVLSDPLAVPIVGNAYAQLALEEHHNANPLRQKFNNSLRALVVARSRFTEDLLHTAVTTGGITQYVLLGAGLDTFAHRNPHPNLHVFEVDHPATQAWKRQLLANAQLPSPDNLTPNLTFVPTNFETQTLVDTLPAAGFNPALPAFFSLLGVVPYLTLPAFRQTLAYLGTLPPTTQLTFDYAINPSSLPLLQRLAFQRLADRVAATGEPFQLLLNPDQMHAELTTARFTHIQDLPAEQINTQYFHNRPDHLQVAGQIAHLLHAAI